MNAITYLAMIGWVPLVLYLFMLFPVRRAIVIAFVFAWLFLPVVKYKFFGLPDYTKTSATYFGVMLGVLLFDQSGRLWSFRPRWFDLPMLAWCLCPIPSAILNGLGVYHGFAMVLEQVVEWGSPYLIGRVYFNDLEGLQELAAAVIIGGLLYVPLCLYEVRMSPQLHKLVYGYYQADFRQSKRWGGYRPVVFMEHGLAVGMWMTAASAIAFVLWMTPGARSALGRVRAWQVGLLFGTAILCKSVGAVVLLGGGVAVYLATRTLRTRLIVLLGALLIPAYVILRVGVGWTGEGVVEVAKLISERRAQSLEHRIEQEVLLSDRALERPYFGWGGYGRNLVYNEFGKQITWTDSQWIIAFGKYGLFGLTCFVLVVALPVVACALATPLSSWLFTPKGAAAGAMTVVLSLYGIDLLLNAMENPLFVLMSGGVSALAITNRHELLGCLADPDGVAPLASVAAPAATAAATPRVRVFRYY